MLTIIGSTIYAADYQYDGLDRVTSVGKEGKSTKYVYDQGGNLLSATSTTVSNVQSSSIVEGWTPYITNGMKPLYEKAPFVEDEDLATSISVVDSTYGDAAKEAQFITLNGATRKGGANVYRDMPVQGGSVYTYQGRVKSEQMKDAVVQVVVNYYDNQQKLVKYDNVINVKQDTDWQSYNVKLTAPSDAVTARVHLQIILFKANGQAKAGFADRTFEKVVQEGGQ